MIGRSGRRQRRTGDTSGVDSAGTVPPAFLDTLLGHDGRRRTADQLGAPLATTQHLSPTTDSTTTRPGAGAGAGAGAGEDAGHPSATRHHNPACAGCRDYAVLLGRETAARTDFYHAGLTQSDALTDLRTRLADYLKARHSLRTEQLKQRGTPLGPHVDNYTLLAALSQWDTMREEEIRSAVARATEQELRSLRDRNAELEERLALHAEQRHRDEESYLEHIQGLQNQADKLTSAVSEATNDRRELSRGAARLADHITAHGGILPTLLRKHDWYRRWADGAQPKTKPSRSQATAAKHQVPTESRQTSLPLPSRDDPSTRSSQESPTTPTKDPEPASPRRRVPASGTTSTQTGRRRSDRNQNTRLDDVSAAVVDSALGDTTAPPSSPTWPDLKKRYQSTWGEPLLQHLWNGSVWTREQALKDGPTASLQVLIDRLIDHGLVALHDPERAQVLTVNDNLGTFAVDVGARLGPRKPSAAARAMTSMTGLPAATTEMVLRVMAIAIRDHHLLAVHRKQRYLPLIQVRPRSGPQMPARWLLPWLPDHLELLEDLLARARARDAQAGLMIAVHRHSDGADDAEWGPLVNTRGYDVAEVKRLWLGSPHS